MPRRSPKRSGARQVDCESGRYGEDMSSDAGSEYYGLPSDASMSDGESDQEPRQESEQHFSNAISFSSDEEDYLDSDEPPAVTSSGFASQDGSDHDESNSEFDEDDLEFGNIRSTEVYRRRIEEMENDDFEDRQYAKGTKKAIDLCEYLWREYSKRVLRIRDWKQPLSTITVHKLYNFLWWYLGQRKAKDGRRKRQVQSKDSLKVFYCNFRLFFHKAIRKRLVHLDARKVWNAIGRLSRSMKHNKRVNRPMTIDDLKLQIDTTLRTTQKSFTLGEHRILAVLFLLLLAPQGSRPSSMLAMQFKHINVLLMRDPENPSGPPRLVIKLTLAFTKSYLGKKATKSFIIPEIMHDPSLLLSPHVFLLAILLRHEAFISDRLNQNPHLISKVRIPRGDNELTLGLKLGIQEKFVFRRAVRKSMGWVMGEGAIPLDMMTTWLKDVGRLAGFEHNTISYTLRYMTGNNLDQNADVSSALRNLVMDHAHHSSTFQDNYLGRIVCTDLLAIARQTRPQQALLKQATSHGHSVSSRRPVELTTAQVEELKTDERYQSMTQELYSSPARTPDHRAMFFKRKAYLQRLRRRKLEDVRAKWTVEQGQEAIECAFRGEDVDEADPGTDAGAAPMSPLQQIMNDALNAPLVEDVEAQFRRRTDAILALMAYCEEEEPRMTKIVAKSMKRPPPELGLAASPKAQIEAIKKSVFASATSDVILRCFLCVAKAEALGTDHPSFDGLCHQFARAGSLARHFISIHLDPLGQDDSFVCSLCQKTLIHKMHLQNHAQQVHGINTNIKFDRLAARNGKKNPGMKGVDMDREETRETNDSS